MRSRAIHVILMLLLFSPGLLHAATSEETAKSYFEEGMELNKLQRYDEAIRKLTQAVQLNLESHKYHQALFMIHMTTRQGLKAIGVYQGMVREHPGSPAVHYWLGRLYLQSQSFDDAIREFREATRIAPNDEHAWISLGHVYYRQGKDHEAMKAYQEANRLSPHAAVVHAGLGTLYLKKKDNAKARKELEEALRIDSSLTEARYNLSLIYDKAGETTQAAKEWERILEEDPNEWGARERLARFYFKKGRYAEAVREFSTLSQVRLNSAEIHLALGESQILLAASLTDADERAHSTSAAVEAFQRVLELDPKNADAKAYLDRLKTQKSSEEKK